jgi:Esterase-like activity of phytase
MRIGRTRGTLTGLAVVATGMLAIPLASGQAGAASIATHGAHQPTVEVYSTHLPPLATIGGVKVSGGGYGSALAAKPGSSHEFYGLTDRGPNVDAPNGTDKIEPIPSFTPSIGLFRFTRSGDAVLERRIPLRDPAGHPYVGAVNPDNSTSESIVDLDGTPIPPSPDGYDPEGLVALQDGSFWVSDEYGPFITHFDARGRQIGRFSPIAGSLPVELQHRVVNKGMEGLTLTPDGRTLVGIMQNTLATGLTPKLAKSGVLTRIVTLDLRTRRSHEYAYLLDSPSTGNSEITALSNHEFLVDERDGTYPSATGDKKLWKIDLRGATDLGPHAKLAGATYQGTAAGGNLGLTIGGKTPEQLLDGLDSAGASVALRALGIKPAVKPATPFLDVDGLLTSIDPAGTFFAHDKIEGVVALDGGRTVVISNDSDFGIDGALSTTADGISPPYALHAKITPAGVQDDGQFLVVHLKR